MRVNEEIAEKVLRGVAPAIADQTLSVSDKLAIGTGAALVLIVSQLAELSKHIDPIWIFISAVVAVASLLSSFVVRWYVANAKSMIAFEPELAEIAKQAANRDDLDVRKYYEQIFKISVWPITWLLKFKLWRDNKDRDSRIVVGIVQNSQRASRFVLIQFLLMILALLLLLGNFSLSASPESKNVTPAKRQSVSPPPPPTKHESATPPPPTNRGSKGDGGN